MRTFSRLYQYIIHTLKNRELKGRDGGTEIIQSKSSSAPIVSECYAWQEVSLTAE